MYSQSIVEERLVFARETFGFPLEYHSPREIDDFDARLEQRYPDAYAQARSAAQGVEDGVKSFRVAITRALCNPENPRLTRDEVRFIQNERALIQCDAAYFMTRYYWIINRENMRSRFQFQAGQRILFEIIAEMEQLRIAIEILIAKARQLGMTTVIIGLELLKVMFSEGVGGIMASADRGKTKEMVSKMFYAYDKLPWWIPPLTSKRVESDAGLITFAGMDSKIVFQHGKQTNPIAMGSTPVTYELSEVSSYPNPEILIEVGLFKCVHPSPRVLGFLESTCKGDTGWFYDTYWNCKANWKNGKARLKALFLPFVCGTDMYPNETWLRKSPIPHEWKPEVETRKMIAETEMYIHSDDLLERVLCRMQGLTGSWVMPREQAWYWEQNHKEHRDKGAEKTWFQEMPHTDHAAFQGSYDNVFGREIIAEVYTGRKTQYAVYGIVGQSIEDCYEPSREELDLGEKIVSVTYRSRNGDDVYRWELWPLEWTEPFDNLEAIRDDEQHMGKLFVWHPPEPGYDYSIGVDTSNGLGSDATAIAVNRRGRSPQEQDVQAAEFRSNQVSHVEAYAWVLAIAAYYARYMEGSTSYTEPYVAIEQIAAVGDTCQLQMKNMGYRRFHRMGRYDSRSASRTKANSNRDGWYTSAWSRPILTDGFVTLIKNGWYKVNSPYTMREMTQWQVHFTTTDKTKFEHAEDSTDDGIFANAMASFCPNDIAKMADRSKKQFVGEIGTRLPTLDLTVSGGIVVSTEGHGIMDRDDIIARMRGW